MDLPLVAHVLWRHKRLIGGGFVVAVLLAGLAFVRVNPVGHPKVSYREKARWVSYVTLLVSQEGFPWGRSTLSGPQGSYADPSRFSELATIYSHLAVSDDVLKRVMSSGPFLTTDLIQAAPILASDSSGNALPLIQIAAIADSTGAAKALARREMDAFLTYLKHQQIANKIAPRDRVVVTVVNGAQRPKLFAGRSKVPPMIAFVLVMAFVIGLAFMLENLRPRRVVAVRNGKPVAPAEGVVAPADASRMSA